MGRFRRPAGELIAHLDRTEIATADAGGLVSLWVSDHRTVEPDGADRVLEAVPRAPARRRGARQVQAGASAFPRKRFRGNVPNVHDYQSDRWHLGARMGG